MINRIVYAMYAELPHELRYQFYILFTYVSLVFIQQIFLLQIQRKRKRGEMNRNNKTTKFRLAIEFFKTDFENLISGFDLSCYIQ